MKLIAAKIVVAGFIIGPTLLSPTPASAVPQWVEDLCYYHAVRVRPALTAREREAYMANCFADYTAGSPPPPRSNKNTNRNRY